MLPIIKSKVLPLLKLYYNFLGNYFQNVISSRISNETLKQLLQLFIVFSVTLAIRRKQYITDNKINWKQAAWEILGAEHLMSTIFSNPISKLVDNFILYVTPEYFQDEEHIKFSKLENEYNLIKYNLDDPKKIEIKDLIKRMKECISSPHTTMIYRSLILKSLDTTIALRQGKKQSIDSDYVKQNLNILLNELAHKHHEKTVSLLQHIISSFNLQNSNDFHPVILLQGLSNTGKKSFCNNISKLLKTPIVTINCNNIFLDNLEGLFKSGAHSCVDSTSLIFDNIANTIRKSENHNSNMILYLKNFDEIKMGPYKNKSKEDWIIDFSKNPSIFSDYVLKNIDISNLILIASTKTRLDIPDKNHFKFEFDKIPYNIIRKKAHNKFSNILKNNRLLFDKDAELFLKKILDENIAPGLSYIKPQLINYAKRRQLKQMFDNWGEFDTRIVVPEDNIQTVINIVHGPQYNRSQKFQAYMEKLLNNSKDKKDNSLIKKEIEELGQIYEKPFKISHDSIEDKIIALVYSYPESAQKDLLEYSKSFIYYVNNPDKHTKKIPPLYLYGEPGVGKSHFVKQLSTITGVPMYRIMASNIDQSLLTGSKTKYNIFITCLIQAGMQAKCNTLILCIDELDKPFTSRTPIASNLESWLLEGSEIDNFIFTCNKTNLTFNGKNIIVIACGNVFFLDKYPALKSRFMSMLLPNINPECKEKQSKLFLQDAIEALGVEANDEINSRFNQIVELDKNAGVRKLENNVHRYIQFESRQAYFSSWKHKSEFHIEQFVDEPKNDIPKSAKPM